MTVQYASHAVCVAIASAFLAWPGVGAESSPMAEAGRLFKEKLTAAAANPASDTATTPMTPQNIPGSVVLIGSSEGCGSGFLCRLWGVPVIVTNAHVYARMYQSTIEDGRQYRYTPKAALISRKRDLALIEADIPSDRCLFEIAENLATTPLRTPANAYGDSLGDRVITVLNGQLLGIGPDEIEISAGIVPGNSGGPVVNQNMQIIGVSTYLKLLSSDANVLDGTRFGRQPRASGIRRFAIRIDNLDPQEFEIFDPEQQKKDLEVFRKLASANAAFLRAIQNEKGMALWIAFHRIHRRTNPFWNYQSPILYLRNMITQEQRVLAMASDMLNLPLHGLTSQENRTVNQLFQQLSRYRRESFRCNVCNGRGTLPDAKFQDGRSHSYQNQPSADIDLVPGFTGTPVLGSNSHQEKICPECSGLGQANVPYYNMMRTRPISVRYPKFRIASVAPGMDQATTLKLLQASDDAEPINVNGIFQLYTLPGNHAYYQATNTYLTFVARRLSAINIHFPAGQSLWEELKQDLIRKFGKPTADFGDGSTWGYVVFDQPEGAVMLTTFEGSMNYGIRLTARHYLLTELEMRFLENLGKKLFIPQKHNGGELDRNFFM